MLRLRCSGYRGTKSHFAFLALHQDHWLARELNRKTPMEPMRNTSGFDSMSYWPNGTSQLQGNSDICSKAVCKPEFDKFNILDLCDLIPA